MNELVKQIDVIKIYQKKNCLVVDDLPEVRGSVKRMLRSFGAKKIDTAATGDQAIELCENRPYDIILCDYNLGGSKDGQQVLEELRYMRTLRYTTLYIIITAETSREMVLGAIEYQPDDYITKPIGQGLLRQRLDKALLKHEELYDIKAAMDEKHYAKAIELCDEKMASGTRYKSDCLRYKAQLYKLLGNFSEARKIYEKALAKRQVIWAKLGLASIMMKDDAPADIVENELSEVLESDNRFIEAHDMLSELYVKQNRMEEAQKATEKATLLSPKSILRHRRLAVLAEENDDHETSLAAYQNAIRWNQNSCHAQPDDYLKLARKTVDMTKGKTDRGAIEKAKTALSMLDRMRKRFNHKEKQVQALMVESQIHAGQGRKDLAENIAAQAEKQYNNLAATSVEAQFDFARSQMACGDPKKAQMALFKLASENQDNEEILKKIDQISDEPISLAGKKCAAELSKEGIDAYQNRDFDQSLKIFNDALQLFPNHIGLNLNLVQVALAKSKEQGLSEELKDICENCLDKVSDMKSDHKQYDRYQLLVKQLARIYSGEPNS